MADSVVSFDNPVFASYAAYAGLASMKMMGMTLVTVYHRVTKNVFANPEDTTLGPKDKTVVRFDHPDIERVRRLHRNDVENIPPFLVIGFLYVLTKPSSDVALWHYRVFLACRLLHTTCYLAGLQPWRAIFFFSGLATTVSMAVQVVAKGSL